MNLYYVGTYELSQNSNYRFLVTNAKTAVPAGQESNTKFDANFFQHQHIAEACERAISCIRRNNTFQLRETFDHYRCGPSTYILLLLIGLQC